MNHKELIQIKRSKDIFHGNDKHKKPKYSDKRSRTNLHTIKRRIFRSQKNRLDDFSVPHMNVGSYIWWDCPPTDPKIYGPNRYPLI